MRIDPELRALRGDTASQRKAQETLESARDAWRSGPARAALDALATFGGGAALEDCGPLAALFDGSGTALALVGDLVASILGALRDHPLGQVPLRHQHSDGLSVLQLAQSGRATLTLLAYADTGAEPPASACFAGGERHEVVLSGAADILLLELLKEGADRAAIDCRVRRVVSGEVLHLAGANRTKSVRRVHGNMVVLRLARSEQVPCGAREYALADGRLLHRASGSRSESRHELALAVLGRMGRRDAAPLMAEMAGEGSDHIRWQALRECLALDTLSGFAVLVRMARDPADPLAAAAGALRAQLLETYPQLAAIEVLPCPA